MMELLVVVFILYVVCCSLLYVVFILYVYCMLYVAYICIIRCTYSGMEERPCRIPELKLINQIKSNITALV